MAELDESLIEDLKEIGQRLRRHRGERELTAQVLEAETGISAARITELERGVRVSDVVEKAKTIIDALDIVDEELDELVRRVDIAIDDIEDPPTVIEGGRGAAKNPRTVCGVIHKLYSDKAAQSVRENMPELIDRKNITTAELDRLAELIEVSGVAKITLVATMRQYVEIIKPERQPGS